MLHHEDIFERNGFRFRVEFVPDDTGDAPWDIEDGHGPVREIRYKPVLHPAKRAGERVMWQHGGWHCYLYDVQEATKIAKRDGWGPKHPDDTKGQTAARAVEADYQRLHGWCNDEWRYIGIVVRMVDDDDEPISDAASLWGIESDALEYHQEAANELADELISELETAGSMS